MRNVNDVMENNEPQVLYEDGAVIVINKPSGLIVHGDGRTSEQTLSDWLIKYAPGIERVGEPWQSPEGNTIPRPGIVHRLDRETSGVMIVAKTQDAFAHLKGQFQERSAKKEYAALVYGNMKEEHGVIDRPIGRSPQDFRRWSAQRGARGEMREARTLWRLEKQGEDVDSGETVALLSVSPETGRTHQIRVHLKAIHHPVVCDSLYAAGKPCILGMNRVALHARALTVMLPFGGEKAFTAPLPPDMEAAIAGISVI